MKRLRATAAWPSDGCGARLTRGVGVPLQRSGAPGLPISSVERLSFGGPFADSPVELAQSLGTGT